MNNKLTSTGTRSLNPWHGLADMSREMEKIFDEYKWPSVELSDKLNSSFAPACEASETETGYSFRIEIPGMDKKDIKIEIDNQTLTVSGERKTESEEKKGKRFFSELSYGSFYRSFYLPSPVDDKNIDAQYKDGVLTVNAKKLENSKAKKISIH